MKIESSLISNNIFQHSSSPVTISQATLDKAKELTDETHKALIYEDKVIALSEETIKDLHHAFTGDIQRYEDVFIATNQAKSYLNKIVDFVMQDLNVQNADKNSDGVLTMAEGLDAKSILQDGKLEKPKDVLSPQEINRFQQDKSIFHTIDEIIEENILLDEDKDGKVSVKEVEKALKDTSSKPTSTLSILYKRLADIEKMIKQSQSHTSSDTINNDVASSLNGEKGVILAQIKKLLELGMIA